MKLQEFVIFGGGNMGSAFASLCINKGLIAAHDVVVIQRNSEKAENLRKNLSCQVFAKLPERKISGAVLLAVKPQDMSAACQQLLNWITSETLIISIMAGVQVKTLSSALNNHKKIVRCMPNTPMQVACGMTGYFATSDVLKDDLATVENILSAAGHCLRVDNEDQLDGVTALSGSGPAYVFYFIEAFLKAAEELGFSYDEAKLMAKQTILGSVKLWDVSKESAEELRKRVTSKGGTTEAALKVFEENKVMQALVAGIKQARIRSTELR